MARRRETRDLTRAAKEVLGHPSLRSGQPEALEATLDGRDVLAVMPTGHGKSTLYQLPAALHGGVTVVVSPLIALQRDQAAALSEALGAPPGRVLNSTQSAGETEETWAAVAGEESLVLLLAPEQLAREDVLARLSARGVALLVVDEAHCISAWGHDFRPDYLPWMPCRRRTCCPSAERGGTRPVYCAGMSESASGACLFCRIVAGSIPADVVAQTEHSVAFRDVDPKAPTHVLVVPRRHVPDLAALATASADELADAVGLAAVVAEQDGLPGYRTVANTGAAAQQSVFHAHLHILGGRELRWPPG